MRRLTLGGGEAGRNLQLKQMSQGIWMLEGPRGHFQTHWAFPVGSVLTLHLKKELGTREGPT